MQGVIPAGSAAYTLQQLQAGNAGVPGHDSQSSCTPVQDGSAFDFTHVLEPVTHTPVLDRTGLTGEHYFDLKFAVIEPFSGPLASLVGAPSPTIFIVLQHQLGFRLERTTGVVDAWVIDRAERPSGN